MKKTTRLWALLLTVLMVAGLTGAAYAEEAEGGTLRVLMAGEPFNIVPQNGLLADGQGVAFTMYDTLLNYNSDTGENEPGIALSYEWLDEYHLQFKIRDDVVAYDGTILTAQDILWSVQKGMEGTARTFWKAVDLAECSAPDDTTFILGLNQVYPTMPTQLSNNQMLVVLDESSCEANGGWEACIRAPKMGTGAYFFEEWVTGDHITLVRNDNYWGTPGYYEKIEIRFNSESAARVMALAADEADVALDLTSVDMLALQGYDQCESVVVPQCGVFSIMLNITNEYLANPKVREAIYYAVNADALNAIATGSVSTIADGPYEHTNAVYSAPANPIDRQVNIEYAKQCMAEAGYPDGGFTLYLPTVEAMSTLAEAFQADLMQIGITVDIDLVEGLVGMQLNDTGGFDIGLAQTFSEDPVNICNYIDDRMPLNERGGGIVGGLPESYELIDKCRYTQDEAERNGYYAELQDFIRDNFLIIPLYDACTVYGTNGSYKIMRSPTGFLRFNTAVPVGE